MFNQLTDAQIELLALLSEELGEAQQAIGKILRHGYESHHPDDPRGQNNREFLESELGDIEAAVTLLVDTGALNPSKIIIMKRNKLQRVGRYLHHVAIEIAPIGTLIVHPHETAV